eukprot:788364_1
MTLSAVLILFKNVVAKPNISSMNTRDTARESDCDLFMDEREYLRGPVSGIYKTTKNARKYMVSGLNSIDSQLKGITFASFNNSLNIDSTVQYIDHWISYLERMKIEIEQFQSLSDFEQNALKTRIDFINHKYSELQQDKTKRKMYYFPYNSDDKKVIENDSEPSMERVYGVNSLDRHCGSIYMDRLLIDYLCRNSYFKTAYALVEDNHLMTDVSNIRLYHKIREPLNGIKQRNCHLIIKWCRANKTLLKHKDIESNLEFLARSRLVIELLRNGDIENATEYITNEMTKDLDSDGALVAWRWSHVRELFMCSMFVPIIFGNNDKYKMLLKCKESGGGNDFNYKQCKKAFKQDLKQKIPKNVYKLLFKPTYYWKAIEDEFWRIFKMIYGLNKHSMLEYVLSSSLQTLLTPYCYHKEWGHLNCITCLYGRSKMSALTHKSHLRCCELANSIIVCDKQPNINHKEIKNKEYEIIRNSMIDNEHSITINSNDNAMVTPNGCIIDKEAAKVLIATNKFIKNDYQKIYLYYHLF